MRLQGKDLVVVGALASAAALATWLFVRVEFQLGAGWTDGQEDYAAAEGHGIRYAVWEAPGPLAVPDELQGLRTSRPALAPDGRLVVFAVGEPGLDVELWAAERAGDRLRNARPLLRLSSPADDVAPAFGSDALYFASSRSGPEYGLDLWRAPYADGVFGAPEPLGAGVNTRADESDPCPVPGTRCLVFASNRARGLRTDFDLYRAEPAEDVGDGTRRFEVAPLAASNTPFDEREPSLSADGRTLVFASDRPSTRGDAGGFDLYRTHRREEAWLPAEPLVGVNTPGPERGPALARDGFTLLFDHAVGDEEPRLHQARSRELFRVPAPPLSLYELLLLISLLILALLAFLAKHWSAVDVLYRCFLVSLVVHLLLMLYLRNVHPEAEEVALGENERLFRVRLAAAPAAPNSAARERAGELSRALPTTQPEARPEREPAAPAAEATPAAAPAPLAVEAPARPAVDAPARHAAPLAEAATESHAPAEVRAPAERPERYAAPAPPLVVQVRPGAGAPRSAEAEAPTRRAQRAPSAEAAPLATRAELPAADRPTGAAPAPRRLALDTPGPTETPRPEHLRTPADAGTAGDTPAEPAPASPRFDPTGGLARASTPARASQATGAPQRARGPTGESDASAARPAPRTLAPGPSSNDGPGTGPERARLAGAPAVAQGDASVALRRPPEPSSEARDPAGSNRRDPAPTAPPRTFDPLAGLGTPSPSPRRPSTAGGPTGSPRRLATPGSAGVAPAAPDPRTPRVAARAPDDLPPLDRTGPGDRTSEAPGPLELTPYRNRFGREKLRALEEHGGSAETERAVAQGLAYLASIQRVQGHWGDDFDRHDKYGDVRVGKTGLALLAFLGAGHTPSGDTQYADVAQLAVGFLLRQQRSNGHFGRCSAYGHGIATYALAECYALTKEPRLRPAIERGIERLLEAQDRRRDVRLHGGWGYFFDDGRVWDNDRWPRVSVTAWQVMALESARLSGLPVPQRRLDQARDFLLRARDRERGAFRYSHDPDRLSSGYPILPASTPAALFALSLLGTDVTTSDFDAQRRFVTARAPRDYSYAGDDAFVARARGNLYFWYYGTLATFRVGGGAWQHWNTAMKEVLVGAQEADGSWEPISVYCRYAGDDRNDRSYATALCVLTLEVYYRYFTPLLERR